MPGSGRQQGAFAIIAQRLAAARAAEGHDARAAVFHLLPENVASYRLWIALQTQWRTGMAGRTGLDYAGCRAAPAVRAIRGRNMRELLLADMVVMEFAYLAEATRIAQAEQMARRGRQPGPGSPIEGLDGST